MSRRWSSVLGALGVVLIAVGFLTAAQEWPRSSPPAPLPDRPVDFPAYRIKTLPNGLTVLAVLHHEQPSVSFRLIVKAGAMQEPADKPGVAGFVASLLDQGTETKSAGQIASSHRVGRRHPRHRIGERAAARERGGHRRIGRTRSFRAGRPRWCRSSGVRARRKIDRPETAGGLDACGVQLTTASGLHHQRRLRSPGGSARIRTGGPNGRATAGVGSPGLLCTDLHRVSHAAWFVPNNALLGHRRQSHGRLRPLPRRRGRSVTSACRIVHSHSQAATPPVPARRLVVVDQPIGADRGIRVGPPWRPARTHAGLTCRLRDPGSASSAERAPTACSACSGAASRPHVRRVGRLTRVPGRRPIVAETDTRSEATADALRLTVEEFWRLSAIAWTRAEDSAARRTTWPGTFRSASRRPARSPNRC